MPRLRPSSMFWTGAVVLLVGVTGSAASSSLFSAWLYDGPYWFYTVLSYGCSALITFGAALAAGALVLAALEARLGGGAGAGGGVPGGAGSSGVPGAAPYGPYGPGAQASPYAQPGHPSPYPQPGPVPQPSPYPQDGPGAGTPPV